MNTADELKFDSRRTRVKTCPCGKSNRDGKFAPFKGHDDRGFCHSCGETFLPTIEKDQVSSFQTLRERKPETPPMPPSYISADTLKATLNSYEKNSFAQFLKHRFGVERTNKVIGDYFIGTTRSGGTIFWQIDRNGRIRSGKSIKYNAETGKRVQDQNPIWAHKALALPDFNLKQCLYGEHLLKGNSKRCAIVESEKTATIASLYFPEIIWLACGGKNGLQTEKMEALRGRTVTLYPDLDGFELWNKRAEELSPMLDIRVSDLLERKATPEERNGKLDLADYLLRFSIEDFTKPSQPETDYAGNLIDLVKGYPVTWDTKPKSTLERMTEKNPAITELIKRLDLIQN